MFMDIMRHMLPSWPRDAAGNNKGAR